MAPALNLIKSPSRILDLFVISGPWIALVGNGAGDIYLVLVTIFLLIKIAYTTKFQTLITSIAPWQICLILFIFWGIFSASNAVNQSDSLVEILVYIRFPLYASVLIYWLTLSQNNWKYFVMSALMASTFLVFVIFAEKIQHPERARLFGTWNQSTKANWFFLGYGLLPMLWVFSSGKKLFKLNETLHFPSLAFSIMILAAMFITGQVYVTMVMLVCTIIFLTYYFILQNKKQNIFYFFAGIILIVVLISLIFPDVFNRFYSSIQNRMPWNPHSDYNMPMVTGLMVGQTNLLYGTGPGEYLFHCKNLVDFSVDFPFSPWRKCLNHPHNLYIQIFAELGVIGLLLLCAFVLSLLTPIFRALTKSLRNIDNNSSETKRPALEYGLAFVVILMLLSPISTYSQAFGQHLNFFIFTGIATAYALYLKNQQNEIAN